MTAKQGSLSINSENMLPIIKKWLYSDHDIFVREVVSNACDAISKLHKLEIMGEYQYPDDHKDSIHVIVDPDKRGQGYGAEMLRLGLIYARTVYRAQRASLGVFENNIPAQRCYRAAGFRETDETEDYPVLGETWKCVHMAMEL